MKKAPGLNRITWVETEPEDIIWYENQNIDSPPEWIRGVVVAIDPKHISGIWSGWGYHRAEVLWEKPRKVRDGIRGRVPHYKFEEISKIEMSKAFPEEICVVEAGVFKKALDKHFPVTKCPEHCETGRYKKR